MESLTEGRIVHYVMPNGEHRPAIVVRVWNEEAGSVNLQVFTDGENDVNSEIAESPDASQLYNHAMRSGIIWRTSISYSEDKSPNTWHWIEKA